MRVLYLIPSLGHSGASRQLEMLAGDRAHDDLHIEVCEFGGETTSSAALRSAGIAVHSLQWRRSFDPTALWRLRGLLHHFQPDLIHAWHRSTLRVIGLIGRKYLPRVVVSQPFAWQDGARMDGIDRWLLRRVARILVHSNAEADLGQRQGLFLEKLAVVPPGTPTNEANDELKPVPQRTRSIVCIGPLEGHKGYRDALWAFDIVRQVIDDVRLVYLGEGPERVALERFGQCIECADLVDFTGNVANVHAVLTAAEVCWIPSRRGGGTQATLEAMLASRPVIACQVPNLQGLIADGQSGFVIPPGDKVALARRTRQILLDPQLGTRLGRSARLRVLQHFASSHFVARCRRVYQEVA